MKSTITLIALTLGLFVSNADAAPAGGRHHPPKKKANPERVFKKRDKDHDRLLSKDEFEKGAKDAVKREKVFVRKDKNSDGKLTFKEFKATGKKGKAGERNHKPRGKRKHK
jgi:hypothetical protein